MMTGVENETFESDTTDPCVKEAILDMNKQGAVKINKHGKVKVPRRLIHCSDGILEEYSTDEDEEEENKDIQSIIDPKSLTWGAYLWYVTSKTAFGGLAVCDFLGEKLAWFFGITSPKYQYAISEVERLRKEEEEDAQLEKEEREAELNNIKSKHEVK